MTRCDKLRVAHRRKGSMGFKVGAPRVMGRTARGRHAPPTAATRRQFSGKKACRQRAPDAASPAFSTAFSTASLMASRLRRRPGLPAMGLARLRRQERHESHEFTGFNGWFNGTEFHSILFAFVKSCVSGSVWRQVVQTALCRAGRCWSYRAFLRSDRPRWEGERRCQL